MIITIKAMKFKTILIKSNNHYDEYGKSSKGNNSDII